MTILSDGGAALDALYWRAEILQAMYWMRGEGIAATVDPARLAEFLAVAQSTVDIHLRLLTEQGFLRNVSSTHLDAFALTERGIAEGGRTFQDEFATLTQPAHYECAPGCWCHDPDHVGEPCPSSPAPRPQPEPRPPPAAEPDHDL